LYKKEKTLAGHRHMQGRKKEGIQKMIIGFNMISEKCRGGETASPASPQKDARKQLAENDGTSRERSETPSQDKRCKKYLYIACFSVDTSFRDDE
jgi:hypothetical protein